MNEQKIVRVRDVMKSTVEMIDGMATVATALDRMCELELHCLIVDKHHEGDEYGILLVSDIAREVLSKDRAPERVNVYEICTKPMLTVAPGMDVRHCARLLTRFKLNRAPVMEDGKVIGIINLSHLVFGGLRQF